MMKLLILIPCVMNVMFFLVKIPSAMNMIVCVVMIHSWKNIIRCQVLNPAPRTIGKYFISKCIICKQEKCE